MRKKNDGNLEQIRQTQLEKTPARTTKKKLPSEQRLLPLLQEGTKNFLRVEWEMMMEMKMREFLRETVR